METATVKSPVMLYTEQTPNPETLKFVTNRMLYKGTADFKDADAAQQWSPIATALFDHPYVKGVYVCNNFVTVTKEFNYAWEDITLRLKEFIKQYIADENPIMNDGYEEAIKAAEAEKLANTEFSGEDSELVVKIKELIDTYVKPAVEMDGGNIEFKSFNQGVVSVVLQGSCSGCPSSTVTLKSGIEGMLKRMVPEVTEVVAEMG
jgi:NFU1 iron-sulfur cluster scaffold homolog, mitochondrial